MITISTRGRYGLHLMINLARHYNDEPNAVILRKVAAEAGISARYLEHIIVPLKFDQLIKSSRGAGGGYALARNPSEINVCDILQAVEGTCALSECVEDESICDRANTCGPHEIWRAASVLMKHYFESVSLADILEIADKKIAVARKKTRPH